MIRIVAFAAALLMAACSVKHVTAVKPPAETQTGGNSYTDLLPGTTVRIVLPLLEEGKSVKFETPAQPGTITVHGIAGYRIVRYAVVGDANGVQLRFASSEASRDGKTTREEKPPRLPFALPRGTKHIRLVYMIRLSHASTGLMPLPSSSTAVPTSAGISGMCSAVGSRTKSRCVPKTEVGQRCPLSWTGLQARPTYAQSVTSNERP